jgi:hypothetical protein
MGTRRTFDAAVGLILLGMAAVGVVQAEGATPTRGADGSQVGDAKQAAPSTQSAPIGDDLIYDFVGPNVSEGHGRTGR